MTTGRALKGDSNGLLNEMTFFNGIPEDFKEVLNRMDELGSATTFNHYPIGWAHAMNTPFSVDEAGGLAFGGTRNGLVMVVAGADQGQGRHPHPVSPRDRHRARRSSKQWRSIAGRAQRRPRRSRSRG